MVSSQLSSYLTYPWHTFSYAFLHFASRTLLCPDFPPFPNGCSFSLSYAVSSHAPDLLYWAYQSLLLKNLCSAPSSVVWVFPPTKGSHIASLVPNMGLYGVEPSARPLEMLPSVDIKLFIIIFWINESSHRFTATSYKGFPLFNQLCYSKMARRLLSCFLKKILLYVFFFQKHDTPERSSGQGSFQLIASDETKT
jgi:hypothetical protein